MKNYATALPQKSKKTQRVAVTVAVIAMAAAVLVYMAFQDQPPPAGTPLPPRGENMQDRFDAMGAQLQAQHEEAQTQGAPKDDGVVMYGALDPSKFALTAKSFGGHPAYGEAMLRITCMNYLKSRDNHVNDLAQATAMQRSGLSGTEQLPAELLFNMRTQEIQCQQLTPDMLAQADTLMKEAAAAGDVSAQTIVLKQRGNQVLEDLWKQTEDGTASEATLTEAKALLPEAVTLADKGNQQAALLAARLTANDSLGQKNVEASATWMLVGVQGQNEPFRPELFEFDRPPYSQLSASQRGAVIDRARLRYEACCLHPVAAAGE